MSSIKNFGEPMNQMAAKDMLRLQYNRVSRCKILEKNKMKLYYAIMLGGCIYLYNNDTDKKWKRVILLKQIDRISRLNPVSGPAKDNICVELLHLSVDPPGNRREKMTEKYIISTNDESDRKEWMMALFETLLIYHGMSKSKDDIQKLTYLEMEESITNLRKRKKMEEDGIQKRDTRYTQFPFTGAPTRAPESVDENSRYDYAILPNEVSLAGANSILINNHGVVKIKDGRTSVENMVVESIYENTTSSSSEGESPDDEVNLQDESEYANWSFQESVPEEEFADKDETYENVTDERASQPNRETLTSSDTQHRGLASGCTPAKTHERHRNVSQRQLSSTGKPKSGTSATPGTQRRGPASDSRHETHAVQKQNVPVQHQKPPSRKEYMFSSKDPEVAKACLKEKPTGTFLIQKTKDPDQLVLVVKLDSGCGRCIIKKDGDTFYMVKSKTFGSLQEVVGYYQKYIFDVRGERLRLDKGYQCFE